MGSVQLSLYLFFTLAEKVFAIQVQIGGLLTRNATGVKSGIPAPFKPKEVNI
jgi:hypothetical protein